MTLMVAESSVIVVDGTRLTVELRRKAVKHVNARLRGDILRVSVPLRLGEREAAEAVGVLARRLLRRARARAVNGEDEARRLAVRVAARFPQPPPVRDVRFVTTQRARWGSFSLRTGTIRLHAALRQMPPWVLEAVVAHELAHAVHPGHGPEFRRVLRQACPDSDRATAFLAGVSWTAARWESLPPVERALLADPGRPGVEG